MKISQHELCSLIKEEINEIFGRGKRQPPKEYPASELATIIKGLNDASKLAGAELTDSQREAIVDELTGVLEDEGFIIKEDERLFTGEEDVVVTHQNAPKLKVFLNTVAQKSPKVFKQLLGLFNRSALDISPIVKSVIPSATTVADPPAGEDKKATIKAEPAAAQASSQPAPTSQKARKLSRRDRRRLDKLRHGAGAFEPESWAKGGRGTIPAQAIMDLDLEDAEHEEAVANFLRDKGYEITEAEIKKLKVLAGIK